MALKLSTIYQSKTVRTIAVFATGNTVAMLLGVVGSLVMARYVGPQDMGVFRTFAILAGYILFMEAGVFEGFPREYLLQIGRGDQAKAEHAASACLAWIAFVSLVGAILFVSLAFRAACYRDWMQFWGWMAYIPVVVYSFYGAYLGSTYRTNRHFVLLSNINVTQAVVGTLFLPLLPIMGYYGACLRIAGTTAVQMGLLHHWRPLKIRPRVDWRKFFEVIRVGLPLSATGYLYTSAWYSLEGTLVLAWFGTKAMGLYTIAVFSRAFVMQLGQNVNQFVNVKIFNEYGRTNCVEDCLRLILKPMMIAVLASLPLVVIGWLLLPHAIRLLVPKYVEAIFISQLMLLMLPIMFLRMLTVILWATGRQLYCFATVGTGVIVFLGCAYLLHWLKFGVPGVAIAFLLGMVANALTSSLLIWLLILQEKRLLYSCR